MARPSAAILITALAIAATALLLPFLNLQTLLANLTIISTTPNPKPSLANIHQTLSPLLSSQAQILLPGSQAFNTSTDRWQAHAPPTFAAVVQAACEADVQAAVRWANGADVPFLAISGGHGATAALGRFKDGLGIWMRGLRGVEVLEGGERAWIGGGGLSGEVVGELWERGKMAVTGACDCTGMVAPMLGGGHGWLQGRYGLLADNLVSARLVLANGSAVTVSETQHPDLLWALKGAGHNFGIVTSFEYKIYDRTPETEMWSWETFVFKRGQVRDVYGAANGMLGGSAGEQPVELAHWSYFINIPEIDPEQPVILFTVIYQSPAGIPSSHTAPLHSLNPLTHTSGTSTLPDFSTVLLLNSDGPFCQHGSSSLRFPVSTSTYSLPALEAVMETFAALPPDLARSSGVIFEAYSLRGVRAVNASTTAFAHREDGLLMAPVLIWNAVEGLEDEHAVERTALAAGKGMREALVRGDGGELRAYVNYAHGDEGLGAMYGRGEGRVRELRRLKGEWDPEGRFGWYAPIE